MKARGQVSFSIADKGDDSFFISLNPSPLVMSDKNAASAGGSAWYSEYKSILKVKLGEDIISVHSPGTAPSSYSGGQPVWPLGYPIHVEVGEVKNMDGTTNSAITLAYRHREISYEGDIHLLEPYHEHSIYVSAFNDLDTVEGYVDIIVHITDADDSGDVPAPGTIETELYKETIRLNFSVVRNSRDSIDDYGITDAAFGTQGAESIPVTLGNTTKDVITAQARQANKILAGPASGNNAAPTFRTLVVADIPLDDRLSYVEPNAGESITIEDTGTTGTVLWGAESATQVALDVNGTSKLLVKYAAIDGINSSISTLLGYFTNGSANNALNLGGHAASYFASTATATTSANGLMSSTDKSKLDGIASGAQVNVLEGVKINGTALSISSKAVNIPLAGSNTLGVIKIGTGLTIDANGVVSVTGQTQGTVTSVAMSVPTGFSVSGSPITSSGTLALSFASGYSLPSNTTQASWTAKYDKPSGGIPKTDLASAVQTSLGLADSALQSHQTVTLASGTNNGTLKITTAAGTTDNVAVTGLGTAAYKGIATSIGSSITNLVSGALLYSVLGGSFDSSNTVVGFINSSIATATATYRGSYNVVSDLSLAYNATHAQIETALGTAVTTADDNDYCFVEIPVSGDTGAPIGSTERYKFNGTSWSYEYALNNSGFTAAQWSAINSGITSSLVTKLNGIASGAQVNVIESVKVNGTALTVSSKAVDITAVPLSIITGAEDLQAIEALTGTTGLLKKTAANTWALDTTDYITASSVAWRVEDDGGAALKSGGFGVNAYGGCAVAFGYRYTSYCTISANGDGSHAFGWAGGEEAEITANGLGSVAHGYTEEEWIIATGKGSHAEGNVIEAAGDYSHAEGYGVITNNAYEHSQGYYNKSNKVNNSSWGNSGNTLFSIGCGSSSTRANAFEVMQNGDIFIKGAGGYDGTTVSGKIPLVNLLPLRKGTGTNSVRGLGAGVSAAGNYSFAHGFVVDGDGNVSASGVASVALGYATMYSEIKGTSIAAFAQGYANDDATIQATNTGAFAHGHASDNASITAYASGTLASGYAEEGGSITASGQGAIAFGYARNDGSITASGYGSLAFGFVDDDSITAPGYGALAFGRDGSALGDYSFSHGRGCSAIGDKSTAQGGGCTAHGDNSFASGSNVYAMNDYEQAFGMYNYYREGESNADTTIFSVGVGASNARKNAIEIMRDGKVYLLGNGGYNGSSLSSVTDIGTLIGGMVLIGNSASYDTTDLIVVN